MKLQFPSQKKKTPTVRVHYEDQSFGENV